MEAAAGPVPWPVRRETKINLVIVTLLVVGSVPGAVRVFYKRYTDEGRRLALPDTARPTVPYMFPLATPTKQRVVPEQTAAWIRSLATGRLDGPFEVLHEMSPDRTVETAARAEDGTVLEIAWDGETAAAWIAEGAPRIPLPAAVAEELRNGGYVKPPKAIALRRTPPPARPAYDADSRSGA